MLTFLDGPAKDVANGLCIRRAPLFLRVVVDDEGKWDALDQPSDTPRPWETLYAYRLVENRGTMHIRRQGGGGCFVIATYRFIEPQPDRETMRLNAKWREWAAAAKEVAG